MPLSPGLRLLVVRGWHQHTAELRSSLRQVRALQLEIKNVGKVDPKRHLEEKVDVLMTNNVVQCLGAMLDTIVFKWIAFVLHVLLLTPTFWPTEYLTPCPLKIPTIENEVTLAPPWNIVMMHVCLSYCQDSAKIYCWNTGFAYFSAMPRLKISKFGIWINSSLSYCHSAWRLAYLTFQHHSAYLNFLLLSTLNTIASKQ